MSMQLGAKLVLLSYLFDRYMQLRGLWIDLMSTYIITK